MKNKLHMKGVIALILLCLFPLLQAQQPAVTVSGTVISGEDNSPLPMATVQIKGTNQGTVTDQSGKFYLPNVPSDATLVFSYVGMETVEEAIGGRSIIDITLDPDVKQLDKVIVIGYGTAKKSQIVGSISRVSNEDIAKQPVLNAAQGIQGKTAGVVVINSGEPGKAPEVRIRGTNSITGSAQPIYIVDGVIVSDINTINTSDIESMDVLKDAASQAIYGSRSSNGVILVTTKSGKLGKMRVNVDSYVGFRSMTSKVEMADAKTYAEYTNEARAFDNQVPLFDVDTLKYNTDWFDAITRNGMVQNYNINLSGGTEKTTYYFSADYFGDEGIVKGNYYNRLVLRSSNEYKLNKYITFGQTLNFTYAYNNMKPNVFTDAYRIGSTAPIRYPNGKYGFVNGLSVSNPVAALNYTHNYRKDYSLLGNVFLEIKPFKGITLKSSLNFNKPDFKELNYTPEYLVSPTQYSNNSTLTIKQSQTWNYILDNIITYENIFLENHEIRFTLGYTAEKQTNYFLSASRNDVPELENLWYFGFGDPNSTTISDDGSLIQRASYFSRLIYTFKNKYNFSGVLRRDGSSLFPPEKKWGTFYSTGFTWIISREPFIENLHMFDELKLRASYGLIGNDNIPYSAGTAFLQPVTLTGNYGFGGNSQPVVLGLTFEELKDASLSWETTKGTDIGLEFGLFQNKLFGEIGWYSKLTNAYVYTSFLTTAGDKDRRIFAQAADIRNKGIELIMNWKQRLDFGLLYKLGFNITFNQNNVENVKGNLQLKDGSLGNGHITTYTIEGQPIGSFWVYKSIGIYQSQDEINSSPHLTGMKPGDLKLEDVNKDGVLDERDRIFVGSYQPKAYFGVNLGLDWKNIDFSVDCYGLTGNKIYNGKKGVRFGNDNIEMARAENRWSADNPNGKQPRASNAIPAPSTYFVESGDFFRINNITLGYTFNSDQWKVGMTRLRVYATAQNPVIWKKYSGFTTELPGSVTSSGIELGIYPVFSTYMLGINLSF